MVEGDCKLMNQIFLDSLGDKHLNDFQKQMIIDVTEENYQSVYDNLAQNAKIIGEHEIWESVLFCASLKIQNDINSGKIDVSYAMSHLWEKVITIMNMKRDKVPFNKQKVEMEN